MATAFSKTNAVLSAGVLVALAVLSPALALETLDISSLINTNAMFTNANLLIGALGGIVLVIVGFNLAKFVIRFVINIFNGFSI